MIDEIKIVFDSDNPKNFIELSEKIGNEIGRSKTQKPIEIFRLVKGSIDIVKKNNDFIKLHMIRPRLAVIISQILHFQRSSFERYMYLIIDCIHFINKGFNDENKKFRLEQFENFLDAVTCFSQYSSNLGARYIDEKNPKELRDKFLKLQKRLSELLQFLNISKEKAKVFISYSHKDKVFAEKLIEDLESRDIIIWYDDRNIDIGDVISEAISSGIEKSYCYLMIVSPSSLDSKWVKFELDEAYQQHINKGKKVLPVVIGDLNYEQLPRRLKKHLYADFRKEYDKPFEKLYRSIVRDGSQKVID